MSHAWRKAFETTLVGSLLEALCHPGARLLAQVQLHRRSASSRKALSELSEEQLKDAGIDYWKTVPPQPIIDVEAGLMQKLMSMR